MHGIVTGFFIDWVTKADASVVLFLTLVYRLTFAPVTEGSGSSSEAVASVPN